MPKTETSRSAEGKASSKNGVSESIKRSAGDRFRGSVASAHGLGFADWPVVDARVSEIDLELGGPRERTLNEGLRQWILDVFLKGPAQRTSAIAAIAAGLLENVLGRVRGQADLDLLADQVSVDLSDQQVDDFDQIVVGERCEENDFIQAVEELRIERPLHFTAHHLVDLGGNPFGRRGREAQVTALLEESRAQVGGHDDDGVLEVNRIAEPVG